MQKMLDWWQTKTIEVHGLVEWSQYTGAVNIFEVSDTTTNLQNHSGHAFSTCRMNWNVPYDLGHGYDRSKARVLFQGTSAEEFSRSLGSAASMSRRVCWTSVRWWSVSPMFMLMNMEASKLQMLTGVMRLLTISRTVNIRPTWDLKCPV